MRKLLVVLLVGLAGYAALAEGIFLGLEIAPPGFEPANYGVPFFCFGWDNGDYVVQAGSSQPVALNAWYTVSWETSFEASTNWRFTPGAALWVELEDFGISDSHWSLFLGAMWKLDKQFTTFFRFHVPLRIDPGEVLLGSWCSLGFTFYPWGLVE